MAQATVVLPTVHQVVRERVNDIVLNAFQATSEIYVDPRFVLSSVSSTATVLDGSINAPFDTIQAALDLAATKAFPTTLILAPFVYTESFSVPAGVGFIGRGLASSGGTVLSGAISFAAADPVGVYAFRGLTIPGNMFWDATTASSTVGIFLDDCRFTGVGDLTAIGKGAGEMVVIMTHCASAIPPNFTDLRAIIQQCEELAGLEIVADVGTAVDANGHIAVLEMASSGIPNLTKTLSAVQNSAVNTLFLSLYGNTNNGITTLSGTGAAATSVEHTGHDLGENLTVTSTGAVSFKESNSGAFRFDAFFPPTAPIVVLVAGTPITPLVSLSEINLVPGSYILQLNAFWVKANGALEFFVSGDFISAPIVQSSSSTVGQNATSLSFPFAIPDTDINLTFNARVESGGADGSVLSSSMSIQRVG